MMVRREVRKCPRPRSHEVEVGHSGVGDMCREPAIIVLRQDGNVGFFSNRLLLSRKVNEKVKVMPGSDTNG